MMYGIVGRETAAPAALPGLGTWRQRQRLVGIPQPACENSNGNRIRDPWSRFYRPSHFRCHVAMELADAGYIRLKNHQFLEGCRFNGSLVHTL